MGKRIRMEKARPARQKLTALPDIPPYLEDDLAAAERELDDFLSEYRRQPLKWGLSPSFDDIVRPYKQHVDRTRQRIRDYQAKPERYLTSGLAFLAMEMLGDITLSEHQSRIGKQPKEPELHSEDGSKWDSERMAKEARRLGYADSPDKLAIINEIISRSGKSESTVRRALREHGLSKTYGDKKPS